MFLHDFQATCRRRWLLLLALGVVCITSLALAGSAVSPRYEARASFVLIPPQSADDPDGNRYLDLGSLANSVDVVAKSMTSADTAQMLDNTVPSGEYDVTNDPTTSAPVVLVWTSGPSEQSAMRMMEAVLDRLPVELDALQEEIDVKAQFRISLLPLSRDREPTENQKTRLRLLGVLAAALLFGSLSLVAAIDGLLLRRGGPPAGSKTAAVGPGSPPPADAATPAQPPRALDDAPGAAPLAADPGRRPPVVSTPAPTAVWERYASIAEATLRSVARRLVDSRRSAGTRGPERSVPATPDPGPSSTPVRTRSGVTQKPFDPLSGRKDLAGVSQPSRNGVNNHSAGASISNVDDHLNDDDGPR